MTDPQVIEVARKLTKSQWDALKTLPLPRAARPASFIAARPFGSLWRKSRGHFDAMINLQNLGLVERRVSRGEILWRPTKPLGLAVRAYLESAHD